MGPVVVPSPIFLYMGLGPNYHGPGTRKSTLGVTLFWDQSVIKDTLGRTKKHPRPPLMTKPNRKIIQISTTSPFMGKGCMAAASIVALCDDGSVWLYEFDVGEWERIKEIPA